MRRRGKEMKREGREGLKWKKRNMEVEESKANSSSMKEKDLDSQRERLIFRKQLVRV